jgi:hypothetical protein
MEIQLKHRSGRTMWVPLSLLKVHLAVGWVVL